LFHAGCSGSAKPSCLTNLLFDVVTHCFLSSLFSLPMDESLMHPESFIFDNDYRKPMTAFKMVHKGIYEERNMDSAYQEYV